MPPPRKSSPRRRERRSRSRSHSPRHRRKSRSHSRSKDRRSRSRSAQRRRSPERKPRSPKRRSPSPRRRSRSPKRRSRSHSPKRRSRSHSQRRRSRSHSPRRGSPGRRRSPSPGGKDYPVKRPADSSVKRHGYRSRSASPVPVKKSREERLYREESPYDRHRVSKHSQSPVHESQYGGKMYADKPSSSRQPLFPAGTSKHVAEIDYVTIVDRGPPREKLNKRFETLEQASQGPFDFEENITIGIHRGPQHIQLEGDDDIEVNYDFNPKTFKMLFPKKDYAKAIFDRDEIKAFHHDDILDEEAYVEKRTISIKPVDKPKSRKHNDELDYKITVGSDREGYGDRRMVHDSRSRQRPSSSRGYDDVPVTVRLDPRPDPRYEKIYKEQQRYEDHALMQEKVQRNPNDLRYNLMRRRSDGDRDLREAPPRAMDARSRIEARRQESTDRRDRQEDRRTSRGSPPGSADRKQKTVMKTDLPDFKNRPDAAAFSHHIGPRTQWGHCSVCNISLTSEEHALDHVNSTQHRSNEDRQIGHRLDDFAASRSRVDRTSSVYDEPKRGDVMQRLRPNDGADRKRHRSTNSDVDQRSRKRRSIADDFECVSDDEGYDYSERADNRWHEGGSTGQYAHDEMMYSANRNFRSISPEKDNASRKIAWIIGTEEMKKLQQTIADREGYGSSFGLDRHNISVIWNCPLGLRIQDVLSTVSKMKIEETKPHCIVLHVGANDLEKMYKNDFKNEAIKMIDGLFQQFPEVKIVWSQLFPRSRGTNALRVSLDDEIAAYVLNANGHYIRYPTLEVADSSVFSMSKKGNLELTSEGVSKMMTVLKGGLTSIINRNISIIPVLRNLPRHVSLFVQKNMRTKFAAKKVFRKKNLYFKN